MTLSAQSFIYAAVGAALLGLALRALFLRRHLLPKIVAGNIAASGVFLFLVSISAEDLFGRPDPAPQALVLTGIVISVSITAYALALLRRLYDETGSAILPEDDH